MTRKRKIESCDRQRAEGVHTGATPVEGDGPYTVVELSTLTGVKVSSIHHYRRQGLLPSPSPVRSRRLQFGAQHLEALNLIHLLRTEWRVPLPVIGELLPTLLASHPRDPSTSDAFSATVRARLSITDTSFPLEQVLAAARDRFSHSGYAEVSVSQICRDVGIPKASFYRYFHSKDDLFLAAARSTVDAVRDGLVTLGPPVTERKAERQLATLLEPFAPLYLEVVIRELRGETGAAGLALGITEAIAALVAGHLLAKGQPPLEGARRVVGAAWLRLLRPTLGLR